MNATHSLIAPAIAVERQALLDHSLYQRLNSVEENVTPVDRLASIQE